MFEEEKELEDLKWKVNRLETFVNDSEDFRNLPKEKRTLLDVQLCAMKTYQMALEKRIALERQTKKSEY